MKQATRKIQFFVLILALLCCFFEAEGSKNQLSGKERREAIKGLSDAHKYWWDLVSYIALKEEKNAFLSLENDRDRDLFIKTFWLQRDPTPGTPENEYKDEMQKRFAYANDHYGRGAGRPGWMTDMGRFYMILGKPNSVEQFPSSVGLYPAEVWYYYGNKRLGLPTYFNVTFYRPQYQPTWILYNPAQDGPAALLVNYEPVDYENYEQLYMRIQQLAPTLAMPAISMIPNQTSNMTRSLSMRSNLILSNIYESPKREINVSYATNFLNYKGFVDVDASVNYIENTHLVSVNRYSRFGFSFITLSVKPKEISVGYHRDRDQYFFNFEMSVSLKKGEKFIHQYTKNFDFYIDPDKVNNLKGSGVVLHDSFPVIPGDYTLMVFVKNTVGKEFTYFDTDIEIRPEGQMGMLSTPVIGHKAELQPDTFFYPYKVKDRKLFVDTGNNLRLAARPMIWFGVYDLQRDLWEGGRVEIALHGLNERNNFHKKYTVALSDYPYEKNLNILYQLSEEGLSPDYYNYEVTLVDASGVVRDRKGSDFSISPLASVAYPMETFKRSRIDNPYHFYHVLASQYDNAGNLGQAEVYYEKCLEAKPDFSAARVAYLNVLNRSKKYTRVLVEVEALKSDAKLSFEYFLIRGTALYGMKDYQSALDALLDANKIYNSDIRVLNLLGFTLAQLKNLPEAIKAFEASLNLEQKQPIIRRAYDDLRQKVNTSPPARDGQ
jgi:GWxTD domain-containing protein